MSFYCLDLNHSEQRHYYMEQIKELGKKAPHFTIAYLESFSQGTESAYAFLFESEKTKAIILMPGYIRRVNIGNYEREQYDFSSPYGYYGPLAADNTSTEDLEDFWNEVDKWYLQKKIVAEFIRFSLNGNSDRYSGMLMHTLNNIKGKIIDETEQWNNFEHKVRKNVKKAQREQLKCEIYYDSISMQVIDQFYEIYLHTMQRNNASDSFYYSKEKFLHFIQNSAGLCAIALITDQNVAVSTELLLVSDDCLFSFLGGTLSEYFDKRPNDLLKFEVINWGREKGFLYYILGGGYGADDGIYKYKKSFFPHDSVPYYTGRKIIDQKVYNHLIDECNEYRRMNGHERLSKEDNTFFPLYRKLN